MTRKEALEYVNNMWMYEDTKNALETLIPEFGKAGSDMIMDYEKKYKEALKDMRAIYPNLKGDAKLAVEHAFPELKESEDERIIKTIRQLLETARDAHSNTSLAKPFIDALAWLEKRKEPHKRLRDKTPWIVTAKEELAHTEERLQANLEELHRIRAEKEKQKEQKPEWNANDKAFIKDCARILDENGYTASAERLLSMFEQKPVQDREEKEYVRTLKSLIADFLYGKDEIDRGYYQKIYDWLDGRHIKQKPVSISCGHENDAEWSEEDEFFRQQLIVYCEKGIQDPLAAKCVAWLKSLRPQYHGDVTMTEAYKMGKEAGEASHWKPSEEHLSALLAVFNDPNNIGSQTCQLALTDLYEQLKKL